MERVGRARRMNGRMGGERIPNENFDVGVCRIRISSHVGGAQRGTRGKGMGAERFHSGNCRNTEAGAGIESRESGIGNRESSKGALRT